MSAVVRIDPLRFLAGCCKRRLNQAPSVLSLSMVFCVYIVVRETKWVFSLGEGDDSIIGVDPLEDFVSLLNQGYTSGPLETSVLGGKTSSP